MAYDQDAADPLSWNLFSYVRNNPLRYIDPTGRGCVSTQSGHTSTGIPLWTNTSDPRVPGPSCGEIDAADSRMTPSVTVTGQRGSTGDHTESADRAIGNEEAQYSNAPEHSCRRRTPNEGNFCYFEGVASGSWKERWPTRGSCDTLCGVGPVGC